MVVRELREISQLTVQMPPWSAGHEKATQAGAHTTVGPVSRPAGPARWEQPEDTTWSPASCYLHAGPATVGPDRVRAGAGPLPEVVRVDSGLRHDTARAGITAQPNGQLAVTGNHHTSILLLRRPLARKTVRAMRYPPPSLPTRVPARDVFPLQLAAREQGCTGPQWESQLRRLTSRNEQLQVAKWELGGFFWGNTAGRGYPLVNGTWHSELRSGRGAAGSLSRPSDGRPEEWEGR